MNDWIVKLLKLIYERYQSGSKLLKTLVIIWVCVFALILLLCSCTATLSIFKNNSGSSSRIESTTSPSTSVDSTKVNFNPQF